MSDSNASPSGVMPRLSIMMFLQFFVWGAWFVTLGFALGDNKLGDSIGPAYGSAPIAAIFAPLFLGLIVDRFFSSERAMGILFILGAVFMALAANAASNGNGGLMVKFFIAHMLCYMPTLGLSNTVAFSHIPDQSLFPKIRVWGTIGWIAAGLVVGVLGWSISLNIFWLAAASSLVLGVYCFTLPHTPAPAKGEPINIRSLLMLDAFKMLAKPNFLVFMACSTLVCIPMAYYYGITSMYLPQIGFSEPAATMTLGQMSEIFFMLLIPFFFRKLGVKWMIMIGMGAWVVRYLLFAWGASHQVTWMILMAIILHGICYDFFFVTGFMYTDKKAPAKIRGQAQSMLVFFTQGIGMYIGYQVAFGKLFGGELFPTQRAWLPLKDPVIPLESSVPKYGELAEVIPATTAPTTIGEFFASFKHMIVNALPNGIDATLLTDTMAQWKTFWMLPAIMSAIILVIFAVAFWDNMDDTEADAADAEAPAGE